MNPFAFCDRWLGSLTESKFWLIFLSILMAIVILLTSFIAIDMNRSFLTIACDTAAFQSTIANTLAGRWFRDTAYDGPNYLGLHCVPILFPLACLHALLPFTDILFFLQVCGIYSAVIPLYLLAVEVVRKPSLAFFFAASALASPLLLHMAMAPFHPESWILAAVLWSYLFYRCNNQTGFWISLAIGLSCSEQAALIYVALGVALLLREDGIPWRRKYGTRLLVTAFAWLVFCVGFVIPQMHGPSQHNLVAYHYANWEVNNLFGLARATVLQPIRAASLLFSSDRWLYLLGYVGLPLLLTIFSVRGLILLAVFPIYFLMTDQEFELQFHAYYFQFAFLAGYLSVLFALARVSTDGRLGRVVCCGTLFWNVVLLVPACIPYAFQEQYRDADFTAELHQAFQAIPSQAGVYSPHRYSAYLSDRQDMVMGDLKDANVDFDAMVDDLNANTTVHSQDIDFIVCDVRNDQCGPRMSGFNPAEARVRADNLTRLVKSGAWRVAWDQQDVVILQRTGK